MTDMTDEQCRAAASDGVWDPCDGVSRCTKCLQTPGCMIGASGDCQSQGPNLFDRGQPYSVAIDRDLALPAALTGSAATLVNDPQAWLFPHPNTAYCPADDAVCGNCVYNNFWAPLVFADTGEMRNESDSRFCIGATRACVCIYNCQTVPTRQCMKWSIVGDVPSPSATTVDWMLDEWTATPTPISPTPTTTTSASHTDTNYVTRQLLTWTPLPIAILIVLWIVYRVGRRVTTRRDPRSQQRQLPLPQRPRETRFVSMAPTPTTRTGSETATTPSSGLPRLSVPTPVTTLAHDGARPQQPPRQSLELYGWASHRQYLIDTEHRRFNGADDVVRD